MTIYVARKSCSRRLINKATSTWELIRNTLKQFILLSLSSTYVGLILSPMQPVCAAFCIVSWVRLGKARNSSVGVEAPERCVPSLASQVNESGAPKSSSASSSLWLHAVAIRSSRDWRNRSMRKPSRNAVEGVVAEAGAAGPVDSGSLLAVSDKLEFDKRCQGLYEMRNCI